MDAPNGRQLVEIRVSEIPMRSRREKTVRVLVDADADVRCQKCLRPATTISITPGMHRPQRAWVTCGRHYPRRSSYVFPLAEWFTPPFSMRRHLLEVKIHGAQAVRLVEQQLARSVVPREFAR